MENSKTPTIFSPEPWARQTDEEDWEYQAFCSFRDTEPLERPGILTILCETFHRSPHQIKQAASVHRWITRANRYDTWLDASRRRGAISEKRDLGRSMVSFSNGLMKLAEKAIRKLDETGTDPTYRESIELARLSIELQRAGFGMQDIGDNEKIHEELPNDGPTELIEAAMKVQMIIRRRVEQTGVVLDTDIIDGETKEIGGDTEG